MFYSKEKLEEIQKRQCSFKFKDEYDVWEWNPKTAIFEQVKRNYRDDMDKQSFLDFKELVQRTNQITDEYSDRDSAFYDVSVFGDYNFYDLHNYMNALKDGLNISNEKYKQFYQDWNSYVSSLKHQEISNSSVSSGTQENTTTNNQGGEK